jgi:hypothetical protein
MRATSHWEPGVLAVIGARHGGRDECGGLGEAVKHANETPEP